jgi:hypothetical protein
VTRHVAGDLGRLIGPVKARVMSREPFDIPSLASNLAG